MQVNHIPKTGQRGFTLIELMITVAVSGIVATTVLGTMIFQNQTLLLQFERADAQENARVAIEILKRHVRQVGWGFAPGLDTGNTAIAVGTCHNSSGNTVCNGIDSGSDRLRIFAMLPDDSTNNNGYVARAPGDPTATQIPIAAGTPGHPFASGTLAIISGNCSDGSVAADLITITGYGGSVYSFSVAGGLSCDYNTEFNFGKAVFKDFYIDRSDPDLPLLMLDPDGDATTGGGSKPPMIVGYDIEHIQFEYGLDTTDPVPDGFIDLWCDDPRQTADCNTTTFSTRKNLSRVLAVKVAVIARTRDEKDNFEFPTNLPIQDYTLPGGDGYRRWIYRATIALRNVEL